MPFIAALPSYDEAAKEMVYELRVEPKQTDLAGLNIIKTDADTKEPIVHADFEFTSYEDEACTKKIESVQADQEKGMASFLIAHDVMYVKETRAPQGYALSKEVVKVEEKDGTIRVNGREIAPNGNVIEFRYENKKKERPFVPTGIGTDAKGYMLAAMCAGTVLVLLLKGRKKR